MKTQKTKQVRLTLSQVESIAHFYLMSSCDWSNSAYKEKRKGNTNKARLHQSIADDKDVQYKRFKKIREELKGGKQ